MSAGHGVSIRASGTVYDIFEGDPSAVVQQFFMVSTAQNALTRSYSSIASRGGGSLRNAAPNGPPAAPESVERIRCKPELMTSETATRS